MEGIDYLDQGDLELLEIAVVDPLIVQLANEFAQQSRPVPPSRSERDRNLHSPLDDLNGRAPRGCCSALLPGAVAASS